MVFFPPQCCRVVNVAAVLGDGRFGWKGGRRGCRGELEAVPDEKRFYHGGHVHGESHYLFVFFLIVNVLGRLSTEAPFLLGQEIQGAGPF